MIFIALSGLQGAVAAIHPEFDGKAPVVVFDTPSCTVTRGGKHRHEYLIENMRDIRMREAHGDCETLAVIEPCRVCRGGRGIVLQFRAWTWHLGGVVVGRGIPYQKIAPQTWKKDLLRDMARDNKDSRPGSRRCDYFLHCRSNWPGKKMMGGRKLSCSQNTDGG